MKFKDGDIVYHQNTGSVQYRVFISYVEQTEIVRLDSGEKLLCDNRYLMSKGNYNQEMRDKILDSLLDEDEILERIRKED